MDNELKLLWNGIHLLEINDPNEYKIIIIFTQGEINLKLREALREKYPKFKGIYKFCNLYNQVYEEKLIVTDLDQIDLSEEIFIKRLDFLNNIIIFLIIIIMVFILVFIIYKLI